MILEMRGVKETRGCYLARFVVLEFAPYLLYSGNRDFASSAPHSRWRDDLMNSRYSCSRISFCLRALFLLSLFCLPQCSLAQEASQSPELTRTVRSWEFLPVVGSRAGLFGDETGRFEAWVYPLKIFRNFHLTFHVGGRALPAESLSRTLAVHPESASILYAGDSFRVRETLFVPVNAAAAIILLDVETESPLEIEAAFTPDFQLEWPAALGGTYVDWDVKERAFGFGEETKKFAALVGSPTASEPHLAYETNYSSSNENSMRLGVTERGKERKAIILAASVAGLDDAAKSYHQLAAAYNGAEREATDYYRAYLEKTVSLELPDADLQQAYDWARISTIQGLVTNPYLGTGIVAGYRTSGVGQRPGFAWFFGRDSMWTSFALNAEGDYATTRTAIDFIAKYQRADGKVPHEISQSASLVPWFKDFPYPYVSADATPLLIIAVDDYVRQSGDVAFARDKWDNVWRAYQFLKSTYDSQGLAKNLGIGHGWVEGGPLLPVKNEYYQSGLGVEALHALSDLARILNKADVSKQLEDEFEHARPVLEQAFWAPEINSYAFAQKPNGERADEASVLTTVPMWFGLSDENHAEATISRLSNEDHQTDWGMRIISNRSKVYDGSGYHYGSVWPLFTGWASVAEYRYHRQFPAYLNLRSNALLGFDGALGHFSEVLSGDYNQSFSTSSPHQIWSAAMVISPILRGMFGLETDAEKHQITLAPHVPADWASYSIRNVQVSGNSINFQYKKTADAISLEIKRTGSGECWVEVSPAFSLRTQVVGVALNGRKVAFKMVPNAYDQHLNARVKLEGSSDTITIRTKNDFGLALSSALPPLGSGSQGLRVVAEEWNASREQLSLSVSGLPKHTYEMSAWNPSQVSSVDGGTMTKTGKLEIRMSDGASDTYVSQKVVLHFAH